jgi:rubrerythrin
MGTVESGSHATVVEEGVNMREVDAGRREPAGDYVDFLAAGDHAKGEFHCAECGYGVTVYRALPVCPMCGGAQWEQSSWSPLSRARRVLQ